MSEPEHLNAPSTQLPDGYIVQPYIEWNEEHGIYEPIVVVYNPHRNHYPHINAKPFRRMRRIQNFTPEIRAMCSTVFGAMNMAMLNAQKYINQHHPDMC